MYTAAFGWKMYSVIWDILNAAGIIYFPFLMLLWRNWSDSATSGNDANDGKASLRRMQWEGYFMIAIVIFVVLPTPLLKFDASVTTFATNCARETNAGTVTETNGGDVTDDTSTYSKTLYRPIDVNIPLFWGIVQGLGSGLTQHVSANVPCFDDIQGLDYALRSLTIPDPVVRAEYQDFVNDCYVPAKARYKEAIEGDSPITGHTSAEWNDGDELRSQAAFKDSDVYWPGSHYFLTTRGYYAPCPPVSAAPADSAICGSMSYLRSTAYRPGFPYDDTAPWERDKDFTASDFSLQGGTDGPGRPFCDEWWSEAGVGLKEKLVAAIETTEPTPGNVGIFDYLTNVVSGWLFGDGNLSEADRQDLLIMRLWMSDNGATMTGGGVGPDEKAAEIEDPFLHDAMVVGGGTALYKFRNSVFKTVNLAQTMRDLVSFYGRFLTVKEAAPMVQSILIMLMIMILPIYMTISEYGVEETITAMFIFLALKFLSAIWSIMGYLDDSLFVSMYPHATFLGSLTNLDTKRALLQVVLMIMYVLAPILFMYLMAMGGKNFGGQIGRQLTSLGKITV
jgi:hypothetical protein